MTTSYAWAPITKVEDQDDGTVMVYGPATDAGLDRDKQRMNQAWLDTAMPSWMAEGGNIREQHQSGRAVGVGAGLTRADDGTHNLAALVVDPVAVLKVKTGVLKGFSIGVKDPQLMFGKADAPNGEIVGGSIIEVSLVDRPANPRTTFVMVKADGADQLVAVDAPAVVDTPPTAAEVAGNAVLAELGTVLPGALVKADAATDVADAQAAIACIGRIIASEAGSLAAGSPTDDGDIACLLDAVQALKWFISRESDEPDAPAAPVEDSMSVTGDTYMADAVKTETTTPAPAPVAAPAVAPEVAAPPADAPDLTKVDGAGLGVIVKAAVAEAMKPLQDELILVKADLVKALAMPEAGGPVGMRTSSQTQAARAADVATLRVQAADLMTKAESVSQSDPFLARGYREQAADLMTKADA